MNSRILILDSYPDAADSLQMLLQKQGLETRAVISAEEAIKSDFHPEVVLLDVIVPGRDGYEIGRQLEEKFDCAVIVLTGYQSHSTVQQSKRLGWTHLLKPIDLRILLSQIQNAILARAGPRPGGSRNPCNTRNSKSSRAMSISSF